MQHTVSDFVRETSPVPPGVNTVHQPLEYNLKSSKEKKDDSKKTHFMFIYHCPWEDE